MISPYHFLESDEAESPKLGLWLFHEKKHLELQVSSGWRTYIICKKDEIVGLVRLHIVETLARASVKSPFGTIQFIRDLPVAILFDFIRFIETQLRSAGVQTIIFKNPPVAYAPFQNELLTVCLLNSGYRISLAEVGAVITVEDDFEAGLDPWEIRKIRQAVENGLQTEQANPEQLEKIYDFILACREERGQNLSMTLEELQAVAVVFPDRFLIHLVRDEEKLAAASISIRINDHILYNFYSAHPKEYDHLSPAVLLIRSLYEYCVANKIGLLDLGTSALNGIPNFGLLDFKVRLGGMPSAKFTFQKELK